MKNTLSKRFLKTLAAALALPAATAALTAAPEPAAAPKAPPPATAPAAAPTPPAAADDEAVILADVQVEGADIENTVLPVRPNNAFYGFDELLKDTPRSIFQVTPAQIKNDHFNNFSDLSRYSPSIGRGTASNFSTFAKIRGGSADTTRNGILLLNPAVRPFDNNAWESVDIVAGVPSVIQGSTTRTAGVINYVTKKPLFDGEHLTLSATLGRLGLTNITTYGQYTAQFDYNRVLIKDELAARISVQKTDAKQYWANSRSNFEDVYAATTWKPLKAITVDTNFTYTASRGAMPYGINRITQDLIDRWVYDAGPIAPVVSWNNNFYFGSTDGTFAAFGAAPAYAPTKENPALFSFWWRNPADQPAEDVPINGNQTLYSRDSFSDTYEVIGQNITNIRFNEHYSFRNNTLFQYSKSYVFGYDGYHSFMVNKMITSRFEFLTDNVFKLPAAGGSIRHQSNSGFEYRFLWNLCDNAGNTERANMSVDATDPNEGAGGLSDAGLLGVDSLYLPPGSGVGTPSDYYYVNDQPYYPVDTRYGWIAFAPAYYRGGGRYSQLSLRGLSGSDVRINQLQQYNFFTEQKLQWEKFTFRLGARVTAIRDTLEALKPTTDAVRAGILKGFDFNDDVSEINYDINSSLTYKPTQWLSLYAALDHDIASGDCGCCLTQGFTGSAPDNWKDQRLNPDHFNLKSQLVEIGAKFEIIPNKLFANAAYFHQTRHTPIAVDVNNPLGGMSKQTFEGVELSASYQPTAHFAAGINYAYLEVLESNGSWATGNPRNSGTLWATYTFDNGYGLKASAWATSKWKVSGNIHVPAQYNLDIGVFYIRDRWRVDLDITNVTNEKNWAPAGNYAGDAVYFLLPAERLGVQLKATYAF
jgi:hypothetical protein